MVVKVPTEDLTKETTMVSDAEAVRELAVYACHGERREAIYALMGAVILLAAEEPNAKLGAAVLAAVSAGLDDARRLIETPKRVELVS